MYATGSNIIIQKDSLLSITINIKNNHQSIKIVHQIQSGYNDLWANLSQQTQFNKNALDMNVDINVVKWSLHFIKLINMYQI